jgi:hypothetical protein
MVVNRIVFFWLRWQPRFAVGPIYIWKYSCAEWYTVLNHDKLLITFLWYWWLFALMLKIPPCQGDTVRSFSTSSIELLARQQDNFWNKPWTCTKWVGWSFLCFFWFNHFISKGTFHHFSFKLAPGKTCDIWTVSCCQLKLPPFHHISVVYIIVRFSNAFLMMTKTEHVIIFSYPGQFRNTISRHSMPNDSTKKLWNVFRPSTVQFREFFPQQIFSPE